MWCKSCKRELTVEKFHRRNKGSEKRHTKCSECTKVYQCSHYKKNRQQYYDRINRWKKKRLEKFRLLKKKPCVDCHQQYPYCVMDFDHVQGKKLSNVSTLAMKTYSWKLILEEIAKCELVCANCHRIRTAKRTASLV